MDDARLQLQQALDRYFNAAKEAAAAEAKRNEAVASLEATRKSLDEARKALQGIALTAGIAERLFEVGEKVVVVTAESVTVKALERGLSP